MAGSPATRYFRNEYRFTMLGKVRAYPESVLQKCEKRKTMWIKRAVTYDVDFVYR